MPLLSAQPAAPDHAAKAALLQQQPTACQGSEVQGAVYVTDNAAATWKAAVQETVDATLNRTVSSGALVAPPPPADCEPQLHLGWQCTLSSGSPLAVPCLGPSESQARAAATARIVQRPRRAGRCGAAMGF